MSFRGMRERHNQLMAELQAIEAQEAGLQAAQVVTPPKEKLSLGKVLFFLGGLGAVTYFFVFSDESPIDKLFGKDSEPEERTSTKAGTESQRIIDQIKYGKMDDVESSKLNVGEGPATRALKP